MSGKPTTVRFTLSQIEEQIARGNDLTRPDGPEAESLGDDFWQNADVVAPRVKTSIHLRLDSDVLDWFKATGKGHLTRMNAVLRAYVEAHKKAS
jgi:uncharacterized protein (DUF4415 family)